MGFDLAKFVNNFNPEGKTGNVLLILNAAGMLFAAASNTFAAAADKNTSTEDKKFLVPSGVVPDMPGLSRILQYLLCGQVRTAEGSGC